MNQDLSIQFIKENCKTIGDLKRRIEEMSEVKEGNILNTRRQTLLDKSHLLPINTSPCSNLKLNGGIKW